MAGLALGPDGQPQGPGGGRSYIPPHLRNRPQGGGHDAPPPPAPVANGAPAAIPAPGPVPGPVSGPPGPLPGQANGGGMANSAWAK